MNNIDPEILFEDNHLIAINKKPGEITKQINWRSTIITLRYILKKSIKNPAMYFWVLYIA